jgi:hypothetical protein
LIEVRRVEVSSIKTVDREKVGTIEVDRGKLDRDGG